MGSLVFGSRMVLCLIRGLRLDSLGKAYSQSGPVNIGLTFARGLMLIGPYISVFLHYFLEVVFC